MDYSKHFVPLESDPQVFTELAQRLGVSDRLKFIDIPSLDNEVGTSPVPILALILNFPPCPAYEKEVKEQTPIDYDNNEIVWLSKPLEMHAVSMLSFIPFAMFPVPLYLVRFLTN
ncbi:hypothetical protein RU639_002337 [Aspergillus parasiticus]